MRHNLFLGVVFSLVSTFFYSAQAAVVKAYATSLPLSVVIFIQCLTGLILFLPILFNKGFVSAKKVLVTQNLSLHIVRALLSLGIAFCLFASVKYIPFVNAMLLANIAPLIVPFVAYIFLSQKINHKQWVPILIGFVGVAFVLQPDGRIFHIAAFLAIGASFLTAGAMVAVRKLSSTDSGDTIAFYFFLCATIISSVAAFKFWVPISLHMLNVLVAVGVMYALSQYLITYALRFANPQLVSSLLYTNIVYSSIISASFWHVVPTTLTLLGIVLTVVGGILCIGVEYQHRKEIIAEDSRYAKEA